MFWSQPGSLYAEAVKSVRGYRFRRAISFSCRPLPRVPCVYLSETRVFLGATRQSSLILIGRPFRSRNKLRLSFFGHSDAKIREGDERCRLRSFSFGVEHSFFLGLVRVLSEPSRDVNGTYEVESVCLVFHLIRELRSEGLRNVGHTSN